MAEIAKNSHGRKSYVPSTASRKYILIQELSKIRDSFLFNISRIMNREFLHCIIAGANGCLQGILWEFIFIFNQNGERSTLHR